MTLVVVSPRPMKPAQLRELKAAGDPFAVEVVNDLSTVTHPGSVTAIAGVSTPPDLTAYPALRWLHAATAGVESMLTPEVRDSEVALTSSAGNGGIPLAEHALMLMLLLGRDAQRWLEAQHRREWNRFTHAELAGRTVVILGMGAAGRDLARKARSCHLRVVAVTRTQYADGELEGVDLAVTTDLLPEVAAEADFLVVAAPYNDTTAGLIDATVLAALPERAFVICVSRGGIVDDDALLAALQAGTIAGAGLDAHGTEPLPADSPFWTLPNVVVTPHNAATTDGTSRRGFDLLVRNLRRFVADQPLLNVVDKTAGY